MSNASRDYSEKRDFIRMQVLTNCQIQYKGNQFSANCLDLSSKGALIESTQAFEINSEIILIIDSGGGEIPPLHAKATILRIVRQAEDAYHYGVSIDQYL
ncbi:MAG: PilZ domain-containing protein [Oleispira sp.]|nr:PilZ domain-containing protein [Oleispira sp.]